MVGRIGRRASPIFVALTGLSFLAGCSNEPYKAPLFSFLSSYKSAKSGAPVLLSNTDWWTNFEDPTLNALVHYKPNTLRAVVLGCHQSTRPQSTTNPSWDRLYPGTNGRIFH